MATDIPILVFWVVADLVWSTDKAMVEIPDRQSVGNTASDILSAMRRKYLFGLRNSRRLPH